MNAQPKFQISPQEYLQIERQADTKSEFYRGEMFAMSGASREHGLLAMNLGGILYQQLRRRPCEAFAGDMRVKVSPTGLYTYPDLVVVCGKPQFEDKELDTLLNPTVILEVLSASTEAYDRGAKFEQYRALTSLKEYVLVAQDRCHVEQFTRQPDGNWLLRESSDLTATLRLTSIECDLPLADVYEKLPFLNPDPKTD